MKATGIVRRIDDLGRVVIPKEIRRTMRIREVDHSRITLTSFDRFCLAIHSILKNKSGVKAPLLFYTFGFRKFCFYPSQFIPSDVENGSVKKAPMTTVIFVEDTFNDYVFAVILHSFFIVK